MTHLKKGIKLLNESIGTGIEVQKGDKVTFEYDLSLSRGDVVEENSRHTYVIGKRHLIAGLEYSLIGMKEGGERKVKISPHLGYGEKGLEGQIPSNAVLIFDLKVISVEKA